MVRGARQRRGAALHWVAATAVAIVLGGVAYLVTQDSTDAVARSTTSSSTSSSSSLSPAPAPAPAPPPAAARAPAPAPAPPKPVHSDPPPPPPPPTAVRVRIVTHPPDAMVTLDGKKFGRTPLDETIPAEPGKHVFRVRRRGYVSQKLDETLDADITKDISLTPAR